MELRGEQRIAAPRERVWAMLNDAAVLRDCIPGCETLEGSPADGFAARVTTKIGPVKATFNGAVTLSNVNPPQSYTISGEGKGGVAGFAKGGADVHLAEDGSATVLTYLVNAQVGGKLAQLGSRLIDSTAKKLADQFFACFAERAGAPAGASAVGAPAPSSSDGALPMGPEGARLDSDELKLPDSPEEERMPESRAVPTVAVVESDLRDDLRDDLPDEIVPGQPIPPGATGVPLVSGQAAPPEFVPPLLPEPDIGSAGARMPLASATGAAAAPTVQPLAPESSPDISPDVSPDVSVDAVAREVEEEVEGKAAVGFLGGPVVWGLLVILALLVVFYFAR